MENTNPKISKYDLINNYLIFQKEVSIFLKKNEMKKDLKLLKKKYKLV
jgi:hypothetical protein